MIITLAEAFESIETVGKKIQNIDHVPPDNLLGSGLEPGSEKSNKTGIGWSLMDKENLVSIFSLQTE